MAVLDQIEKFCETNAARIQIRGSSNLSPPTLLFPGSFAPLHDGHLDMAKYASKKNDAPVGFEMSISNVDKPDLDVPTILKRLNQFEKGTSVWLTRAPTFAEKAVLFPGAAFILGADTVARLLDMKYYRSESEFECALDRIASEGCRFLAFGRLIGPSFKTKQAFTLPNSLRDIVEFVPESDFRMDLSSTQLRQKGSDGST